MHTAWLLGDENAWPAHKAQLLLAGNLLRLPDKFVSDGFLFHMLP